ncbi:MAG: CocE/NonD family hydrolase [Nocardioidaceae bacterium]
MQPRRVPLALVAGALAATGLTTLATSTGASAAVDDTPGYSLTHITVDVKVGPNGDQPCTVNADIYRPDGATRANPAPAILTTNGFGGSKDDSNEAAIGRGFVKEGYVVLAYSGLGFGGSGCKITLDDPDYDGRAGKQMVGVLAGVRPYTDSADGTRHRVRYVAQESPGDPRVGMIGGSYGGQVQYAVAMQDKRVDALIPIITWNDLSYSLAPNNTDLTHGVSYGTPGVTKKEWVDLFFSAGIADGVDDFTTDPGRDVGCPNFDDRVCPAALEMNSLGYPDDATLALARHASVASYVKRITVPTLLAQGQNDTLFNLQEAVATFRALRRQGTPARMIWQSWGHSGSTPAPGELSFDAKSLRDSYLGRRFLDWMDHYVRGDASAPVGPRFSYFRDWVRYDTSAAHAGTAVAKAYATRSTFSEAPTATLHLTGSDGLTPDAAAVQPGTASLAATTAGTSYSETSGVEGNQVNQDPSDTPGTFASFTSAPLARGTALVGSPQLSVRLSAPVAAGAQSSGPAGHLVLFAKLYDVAPDGTVTLQHRLISPVRVKDVTAPVHVELPAVVHRFAAGHRIRLILAAGDLAYANNALAQPVDVVVAPGGPGTLRLPLTAPLEF